MDELIARHLAGHTTDIEERTLERWRAESAENEEAYASIRALWSLTAPPERSSAPPSTDRVLAEAERRRRRTEILGRLRSPWAGYGLAAAAVAALLAVGIARAPGPEISALAPTGSTASAGDVVTMSLSDGSVVRLAAGTSVAFPPSADERLVTLQGRAFFAVAEDAERPFTVRTDLGEVTVVGTRFEVASDGDGLRVIVVEGTVTARSTGSGASVAVPAGSVGHVGPDGVRVLEAEDIWSLLEWPLGLLVFQETPLTAVATELSAHFGLPVEVEAGLGARRVTAWFADEPLDEVASAVCLVAGARCVLSDARLRIERQ